MTSTCLDQLVALVESMEPEQQLRICSPALRMVTENVEIGALLENNDIPADEISWHTMKPIQKLDKKNPELAAQVMARVTEDRKDGAKTSHKTVSRYIREAKGAEPEETTKRFVVDMPPEMREDITAIYKSCGYSSLRAFVIAGMTAFIQSQKALYGL